MNSGVHKDRPNPAKSRKVEKSKMLSTPRLELGARACLETERDILSTARASLFSVAEHVPVLLIARYGDYIALIL